MLATSTRLVVRKLLLQRSLPATNKMNGDIVDNSNHHNGLDHGDGDGDDDGEYEYIRLVKRVLKHGVERDDRTQTGTISLFGTQSRYSLRDNALPMLTTKKVFWRGVAEELLWFIRGSTDANELTKKGVRIWEKNGSRAFLDGLGFGGREEGDLGPVYGFQWRHYGAKYVDHKTDYTGQGVDQLRNVIETIKTNPDDRRIILCAWNPADLNLMALPPCHCLVQFYVANGELSCQLYQRSGDVGLGVPFNITSYSLLTHMIAHVCGLKAGEFVHTIGDCHIYKNHVKPLQQQVTRKPYGFPKINIKRKVTDIDDFKFEDFEVTGYQSHPKIDMEMAV